MNDVHAAGKKTRKKMRNIRRLALLGNVTGKFPS
jgi:hypothetical protein